MSIAQSLLKIVLEESQQHGIKEIRSIKVQVGALAAVVPEALTFCFDLLAEGTDVAGASLDIETVPLVVRCMECAAVSQLDDSRFACPECGSPALDWIGGRELTLMAIEGELGESDDAGRGPDSP